MLDTFWKNFVTKMLSKSSRRMWRLPPVFIGSLIFVQELAEKVVSVVEPFVMDLMPV
jgi:hypothetical protein